MKYAWIENEKIRDICQGGEPEKHYHPDIAKLYNTKVPDNAKNGDGWANGKLVKPIVPESQPQPTSWTLEDIRNGLTLLERVKWDSNKSDEIKTAKLELAGTNFRAKVQEVLNMLIASGDISQESADVILAKTNETNTTIPVTVT